MKRKLLLIFMSFSLVFVGCSKSDKIKSEKGRVDEKSSSTKKNKDKETRLDYKFFKNM